jgi:hypothetical protein
MKRVVATLAILGVLVVPVLVGAQDSARDEDRIPAEANWSPIAATPPLLSVKQPRTASTAPEQIGMQAPARVYESARDEDSIPPEANWSPVPASPPMVAVEQPRAVSTAPEQINVRRPAAVPSEATGHLGGWDKRAYGGDE